MTDEMRRRRRDVTPSVMTYDAERHDLPRDAERHRDVERHVHHRFNVVSQRRSNVRRSSCVNY